MSLTQNELSVLDLIASDVSYRAKSAFDGDAPGGELFSFQDSAPEKEFGFPSSLLSALPNGPSSPTANTQSQDINGVNTVVFTNWEFVRKFEDPKSGFGYVVYRSTLPIDGKTNYIVAMQGSDGTDSQDWFQNLDLARQVWSEQRTNLTNFLINGANGIVPSSGVIHFTGNEIGVSTRRAGLPDHCQVRRKIYR